MNTATPPASSAEKMRMTAQRWQQVKAILGEALDYSPGAARDAFVASRAGGGELQRDVERLLAQSANDLEDCVAAVRPGFQLEAPEVGRRIGAYQIVRELGRGGMGAVYLGERADREFVKQVAIKLLKRGTDTDEVLRRFRAEREILARLEHPGIARLLDGGTADDGLPYFVMEYVVGSPVTEFCTAQDLTLRDRLQLFQNICGVVHFAHQNLVVHRDLKPANILITPDGSSKLLDFGIAKLLSPGAGAFDATLADHQRLTPAYASPEQVRGEPITTASDVYSLGALLFELLAGRGPHQFSSEFPTATELLRVVAEQSAPRGSSVAADPSVARQLRGDLDRVIAMALRKEPGRRYSGVAAFSEDVRRYLENLPVRARPATLRYRSHKFFQRNKTLTTAATAVLAALLVGSIATTVQAHRAEREARRAEAEARRAASHFQDVRHLASSLLFEFDDAIRTLPGATAARQVVVSRALEYLNKLSLHAADDAALQLELAQAYLKIGDVQGKPYNPNLGDPSGALQSYGRAAEIAAALVAKEAGTNDTAARRELARACLSSASVLARENRLEEATAKNATALVPFRAVARSRSTSRQRVAARHRIESHRPGRFHSIGQSSPPRGGALPRGAESLPPGAPLQRAGGRGRRGR